MNTREDIDIDARIERVVERVLMRRQRDVWHDASSASVYLKISKCHFLRLCNSGLGPTSSGEHRMRRWRERALDEWQICRGESSNV
jgi:hypothetical protein